MRNDSCVYKEVSGSALKVTILNNDDMSFLGNDIPNKIIGESLAFSRKFSVEFLGETTFILGIKIYWDRFKVVKTFRELIH